MKSRFLHVYTNIGILAIGININLQFTESLTMALQETNDLPTGKIHVQCYTDCVNLAYYAVV